jgi:hypothetical protein
MSLDVYKLKERLAVLRQEKGAMQLFGIHGYVTDLTQTWWLQIETLQYED